MKQKKKAKQQDISIAVDIILKGLEPIEDITNRLDRIENLLANLQTEPEKAIILNLNQRQGDNSRC